MTKNIFLIAFLGLLLVACGGSGGTGGDVKGGDAKGGDGSNTAFCDVPANKGTSTCPYSDEEKAAINEKNEMAAKQLGSFFYKDADGNDRSLIESGELEDSLNESELLDFFTGVKYGSKIYFSNEGESYEGFKGKFDPLNKDETKDGLKDGAQLSADYAGGKYIAINTAHDSSIGSVKQYRNFFEIVEGYFLIPMSYDVIGGFLNRYKLLNPKAPLFSSEDIQAEYTGKAWGYKSDQYDRSKVEGSFTLTIDTNGLGELSLGGFQVDLLGGLSLTNNATLKISNLDFSGGASGVPYSSGFFANDDLKMKTTTTDLDSNFVCKTKTDNLLADSSCLASLAITFVGEDASHVGGQLTYNVVKPTSGATITANQSRVFFVGEK